MFFVLFRKALSNWINQEKGFEIFIDVANDKENLEHDKDNLEHDGHDDDN